MAERVTVEIVGIDRASGALRKVGASLRRIAEIAAGIIVAQLFGRLARGLKDITRAALEAFEWFDRIRFSLRELATADIIDNLEAVGLSIDDWDGIMALASEQAKELLDWVIKLALASPFTAEDVNKMFRLIRAYGFATGEAKDLTGIILDFAAATGFGSQVLERMGLALGQVRQRGRLAGEEIRQLINVGIPVRDILAKAMNVTTGELEKLIRKGLVPANIALPAIIEWMKRFDGASERAVQTWHGLLANMVDVKDLNLIALFDGIAKALQPALQGLFDFLSSERVMTALRTLGENIGNFLAPKAQGLLDLLENLDDLFRVLDKIKKGLITPGQGVAGILRWLGVDDEEKIKQVQEFIDGLGMVFDSLAEAFNRVKDAWTGPIQDEFPRWLESLTEMDFDPLASLAAIISAIGDAFERASLAGAPFILERLNDVLEDLSTWWADTGESDMAQILQFLLELTASGVIGGLTLLAQAIGGAFDIITGNFDRFEERSIQFTDTLDALTKNVTDTAIFQRFATTISQIAFLVELWILQTLDSFDLFMDNLRDGLIKSADEIEQAFNDWWQGLVADVVLWGATLAAEAFNAGKNFIESMKGGLLSTANSVKSALERIANDIVAIMRRIFGFGSPSKVFVDFGKQMMAGLSKGLQVGAVGLDKQLALSVGGLASQSPAPALAGAISRSQSVSIGDIIVQAGPGADGQQIAQQIMEEIGSRVRIATASGSGFIGG